MSDQPEILRELHAPALREWPLPAAGETFDKEDRGQVLVVAGSREMPGAAILAATAALRAGAGKLTMATGESIAQGVALAMPEARVIPLPETDDGGFHERGVALLEQCAASACAALLGPGMLDARGSGVFLASLLRRLSHVPVVLDALALDVVAGAQAFDQPIVLTPHAGEMARLAACPKQDVVQEALEIAVDVARAANVVVTLKAATTYIVSPGGACWKHQAAVPGLATSGSGDVLAGIIAGLAARGASLEQAAAWGVVVHNLAGQRLARRIGTVGFLARELPDEVPALLRELAEQP